ncbi:MULTISPECIES: TIGR04282 family arsenosugar biosynthesis glycosyltransferase [Caldimonas]|jgi:rSAM/selenodomain-associated transferase 1|uniref:TIGR04282 family arsenosugar biosynthesis glycosyltransferase n=1 Tax=Caldimonas TaxID=196013 RepID=UPI000381FED7|nr:TIGR04282 family arsenosugar biosynthesis glycosyltransferase [Caldimonas manganoxidans]GIX23550.1 MAG: glycosyl transferase [Caldimonas sp.]
MSRLRVTVFAKAPQPGRVKTRLMPALGAVGAARLAQRMLVHALEQALAADIGEVELCASPSPQDPAWCGVLPCALARQVTWQDQGDGDLGVRLARAAQRVSASGQPLLLMGTDCPALDAVALREAAQALASHEAVLVPSTDGGYVALGVRRPHPSLFCDMPWSTPVVAAYTRARMAALGWRWAERPALTDIDEPEQLDALPVAWWQGA